MTQLTDETPYVFKIAHDSWRKWAQPDVLDAIIDRLIQRPAWSMQTVADDMLKKTNNRISSSIIIKTLARLLETRIRADHGLPNPVRHQDIQPDCHEALRHAAQKLPPDIVTALPPAAVTTLLTTSNDLPADTVKQLIAARQRQAILQTYRAILAENAGPTDLGIREITALVARRLDINPAISHKTIQAVAEKPDAPARPAPKITDRRRAGFGV